MDVACYEDKVVFGSYEGNSGVKLHCYNFETGDRIWERDIRKIGEYLGPDLSVDMETGPREKIYPGAINSRFPLIVNNRIFICLERYVCCFDLETGELIWKDDSSIKRGYSIREVVYKDGKLYGYDVRRFHCFNAETGKIIFTTESAKRTGAGFGEIPFISGETFFTTSVGVYAFELSTGKLLWEYYSKRYVPFATQAVFINGRLYVGCSDGYLYCFKNAKE